MNQYQAVLFYVFTGFFVLIGLLSLSVLLGFPKTADPKLRDWAVKGFVAGVTAAVFGLFRMFFAPPTATIDVTLLLPPEAATVSLVSGRYDYDDNSGNTVSTKSGVVSPVLTPGGTWEVDLPSAVSNRPTRLHLKDEHGGTWQVKPFYPNRTKLDLSKEADASHARLERVEPLAMPGVQVVEAADLADAQGAPRFNNYAHPVGGPGGRTFFEWRVFVDEPPAVLDTIASVDYALDPTYGQPFQTSSDRAQKFQITNTGGSELPIIITVHFKNGRTVKASYTPSFKKGWPAAVQAAPAPAPSGLSPNAAFDGRWLLNHSRSSMGIYADVAREERTIRHQGIDIRTDWKRTLNGGHTQQGTYELPCDAAEHVTAGETMTCRVVADDEIEGYVKTPGHKPPVLYNVTRVAGDLLTVTVFSDPAHKQRIASLVYERSH